MSEKNLTPHSILIVDDHHIIRKTLRKWLDAVYPGTTFLEVSNGEEAVALLDNTPVELVLMDMHLPGMNGIEAVKRIKSDHPETFVVMLTVQEDNFYLNSAISAGANAYVVKREMYEELIPTIAEMMSKNGESR
jgi:DNA-binding NarL/FixJ family response regulator